MNAEIEIRHLRYFVAVAEELHFRRASEKLGIAQPPLSQQIKKLEEKLGGSLFSRTTRGVSLTRAGTVLLERARDTLSKVSDDIIVTRKMISGEVGTLTVGFSGSIMLTKLPSILRRYRQKYPEVDLRLRELVTSEQIEALNLGTIDIGLMREGLPSPKLRMSPILHEPFVAILPLRHRLASRAFVPVSALAEEPFVLFPRSAGWISYDKIAGLCAKAGFVMKVF
jgi:DNA-binding transcriptional LysR family regulator